MGLSHSPRIVTDGIVMCLDAANSKSYPGSGTDWFDVVGPNDVSFTSGPTFSSTNQGGLVFNGTTNEAHPSINHSYLDSSALEVVFKSTDHAAQKKYIFGYRANAGYSNPTIGSLYITTAGSLVASVITAAEVYRQCAGGAIAENTTYHVIFNKDTATGNMEIFVNGSSTGTQTFDAATYGQWTTAGSYIGADILDIGKSTNTSAGQGWDADFFAGTIYLAKVYGRILTSAEVAQNFNAIRGRYGI